MTTTSLIMTTARRLPCAIFCLLLLASLRAQPSDATLFSIGDEAVTVGEFNRIYKKNNAGGTGPSSSRAEYLELYQQFKLKVHHARALGLDTLPRIQRELQGYREQLAQSYLSDDKVLNSLVDEVYDRMQTEVLVRHILLPFSTARGRITDTTKAYEEIHEIYAMMQGEDNPWDKGVARSGDEASKARGGLVGYIKAPLPKGYYELENTIYELPVGQFSAPIKSPRGYHIIRVDERRPAKPEVEIAHLFIRKSKTDSVGPKQRIKDLYDRFKSGERFDNLVTFHSEDKKTAQQKGRIGFVKPGDYESAFEQAVYALTEDGQVSEPVETRLGYHMIQRLSAKTLGSKDKERRFILSRIRNSERNDLAKQASLKRIAEEHGMRIDDDAREAALNGLDKNVFTMNWKAPAASSTDILVTYANGDKLTTKDFYDFLLDQPKKRITSKSMGHRKGKEALFDQFIETSNMVMEKKSLESKYPEFANLMQEYEEGILLFEVSKENIWDRASADTAGLMAYYEENKQNYLYPREADVATYNLSGLSEKKRAQFLKRLRKSSSEDLAKKYPDVQPEIKRLSESDAQGLTLDMGNHSAVISTEEGPVVRQVVRVLDPKIKPLDACRGYVIADYQKALEKNWVSELATKYPVEVDTKIAQKVIQSK